MIYLQSLDLRVSFNFFNLSNDSYITGSVFIFLKEIWLDFDSLNLTFLSNLRDRLER